MAEPNNTSLAAIYEQQLQASRLAMQRQQQQAAEQQALQQQQAAEAAAEAERTRDRTLLETAGDTGLALLQGAVGLGGAGYGLANVATGGFLDRGLGFSQNLAETQQTLEGFKSAPLQARREEASRAFREEGLVAGAGEYLSRPSLLADLALQSASYLIPTSAAARAAGAAAAAGTASRGLSQAAQQVAAQQAATRAGLVSQGALTGGYLNPEAINAAREAGLSEGEQQLAGLGAAAAGAVLNPAISRLTGAAGMEARAAQMLGGASMPAQAGGAAARVGAFATTQAVEEAAQEATEKAIVNVAAQRPIGEGVGESAVLGGILGGALGGAIGLTQIRQPSATRQELADLQASVERELAGQTGVNPLRPSLIRQAGLQDALNRLELSQQLPQVEELAPQQALPVAEEIDLGAAPAPGLTGLNRIVAEQRAIQAQQPPRPLVREIAFDEYAPAPEQEVAALPEVGQITGRSVQDIIRETAPIERVAQQFGPMAAGFETARRAAVAQAAAPQAPAVDVSTPRGLAQYRGDVRAELARVAEIRPANVRGPQFDALVQRLADSGVRPGTPEFDTAVGVEARRQLGEVERSGRQSNLLGALVNRYPVTEDQQLEAAFDRGGVPTTEEQLFGAEQAPAAPGRPTFVDTPAAEVPAVEREQQWVSPQGEVFTVAALFNGRPQLQGPRGNRITKTKSAMEREGWALRQPVQQAVEQRAAAQPRQRDLTVKEQIADLGGINVSYRQDITGDTKPSRSEAAPGRGRVFTESGTSPDDMALQLAERDLIPAEEVARDGGVQWLYNAVNRSLAGEKLYAIGSEAQMRQFEEQTAEQATTAEPESIDAYMNRFAAEQDAAANPLAQRIAAQTGVRADVVAGFIERGEVKPGTLAEMTDSFNKAYNAAEQRLDKLAKEEAARVRAGAQDTVAAGERGVELNEALEALGLSQPSRQPVAQLGVRAANAGVNLSVASNQQPADAAKPSEVTAAPPRYSQQQWAEYMTYPGAAQLNALTSLKEREGNPQPVLAAMLMGIDLAGDMNEFASLSNAAQAHPEFFLMSQADRSQVSTHMATTINRLTGATFELGMPKPQVMTDLQRALALSEDEYIAAVNPTGARDTEDEGVVLSLGDLDTPANTTPVTSFSAPGGVVSVLRGADGTMYAVQNGWTLGSIGAFEDGTGIQLVREAQGKGIGRRLTMEYLRENPFAPAGSFTAAGEANRRSAFRALKAEQAKFAQGPTAAGMNPRLFDKGVEAASRNLGRPIFGFNTVADLEQQVGFPMPESVKGVFLDGNIYVVRENIADAKDLSLTIAHELGHSGLAALLGPSLKAATNRMWANADMRKRIKAKMAELNMAQGTEEERRASRTLAAEEVLADMLAANERLNKDIWSKLRAGVREFFARAFGIRNYIVTNKEVDDLLTDVSRVLKGAPAAQVRGEMQNADLWINDANQAAEADPKFSKVKADMDTLLAAAQLEGNSNVRPFSDAGKALTQASIGAAKSVWTAVKEGRIGALLTHNFMSLDQLVAWYDKLFKQPGAKTGLLSKMYELKSAREAEFNRHVGAKRAYQYSTVRDGEESKSDLGAFSVHDLIGEWDDYKRKSPAKAALLDAVNSEGTFYKVFPDRSWDDQVHDGFDYDEAGYTEADRKLAWNRVSTAYKHLDNTGKTIYQKAQAVYAQMSADRFSAIKAEAERLGKRAEDAARAAGVDVDKVASRVAAAQDRYKKQIATILGKINQGPYSPLMRFGNYVLTVRDTGGNVVHYAAYETMAERDAAAAELGDQPEGYVVSTSLTRDQAMDAAGIKRSEVEAIRSEVMSLLPDDMDPEVRDSAMAAITAGLAEAYLQSLPAKSFAKHAIGRRNIAGYDANSLRAFSNYAIRGARSIAGIKYDGQIGNALLEIDQYVRDVAQGEYATGEGVKRVDATKLQDVANAVKRQHMAALRVDDNKLANALTTTAFTFQLTSPSQLLFNATQTPMVAFPRLAGIYGAGKASAALTKAMRDYTASGFDLLRDDAGTDGLARSTLRRTQTPLDAKVLEVMQQIKDDGPLDITQAHDISGIADGTAGELHPYWGKVMRGLSYFMHKSEVFNRQVTALAAVRMEIERQIASGANLNDPALKADLVRVGKHAIDSTQFNFAKFAKPPVMQGPVGKVVFQYRLFQFNMLSMISRDIRDGFFGEDKESKRIARETLAWTLGMQTALLGTAGTIIAPFAFAIADLFRDDDDLTTSRQAYAAAVGRYAAHGVFADLLDMGRAEAATLIPIIGQSAYAPVGGKPGDTFSYYITQNLGPSFGLAKNLYTGMVNVANGDFEKGVQNLLPKPFADVHKAAYDGANGVRNAQGVVYDTLSPWGAATQFLGFRSGERRQVEARRSAFYTANANAFAVRDRYLAKLALGHGTGDMTLVSEAMSDIQAWNNRYPDLSIDKSDISRAVVKRARQQAVAEQTGIVSSRLPGPTIDAVLGR